MLTRGDPSLQSAVQQQLLFAQLSLYRLGLRRIGRLGAGRRLPASSDGMLAAFVGDASALLRAVQPALLRSPFPAYLALHAGALSREHAHLQDTQQRCAELQALVADLLPPRVLRGSALHTLVRLLEAYGSAPDVHAAKVLSHLLFELGHRAEHAMAAQYTALQAPRFQNLKWSGVPLDAGTAQQADTDADSTTALDAPPPLQLPQQAESLVVTLHGLAGRGQANHPGVRSCLHLLHCGQAQDAPLTAHLRAQLLAMLAVSTAAARLPRYAHCHAMQGLVAAATTRDAFHALSAPAVSTAEDNSRPPASYLPLFLKAVTEGAVSSPALAAVVGRGLVQGRPLAAAAAYRWQPSAIMHVLQFLAGQGMSLEELRCEKDPALKSRGARGAQRGGKALDPANMNVLVPLLEGLQRRAGDVRGDTAVNCLYSVACLAPAERQVLTTLAPGVGDLTQLCLQHLRGMQRGGAPLGEQATTLCGKAVFSARVLGGFAPSSGARVHWQQSAVRSASGQLQTAHSQAQQLVMVQGDSSSHMLPRAAEGRQGSGLLAALAALAQVACDLLRAQATRGAGTDEGGGGLPQVYLPRLHSVHDVSAGAGAGSGAAGAGASELPRVDDPLQSDVLAAVRAVLPDTHTLLPLPLLCNLGVQPDALLLPEGGQGGAAVLVQSWRHCRPAPAAGNKQPKMLSHAAIVQAGWLDNLLPGAVPHTAGGAAAAVAAHSRLQRSVHLLQAHGIPCLVVSAPQWRKWGNETQRRNMLSQMLHKVLTPSAG